jgi:SOS-response transcriptional repressor LexA
MNLIKTNMISERIRSRRKQLGLTQSIVATSCNVTKATVSDWEKGLFQPKDKDLLAKALKTNKEWLMTGKGHEELREPKSNYLSGNEVPLINWVQAGAWTDIVDSFSIGCAEEYYPCPDKHGKNTFALTIVGESMHPEYSPGEIIYVDPEVEAVNGSCVVVRQNGDTEATFKQLMLDGSKKYLKALNPDWPSPIVEILPDAVICGVVIGSYRKRN